jgi:hypothetical protein
MMFKKGGFIFLSRKQLFVVSDCRQAASKFFSASPAQLVVGVVTTKL